MPNKILLQCFVASRPTAANSTDQLFRTPRRGHSWQITVLALSVLLSIARAQDAVPATVEEARTAFEAADAELNKVYKQCIEPDRTTVQAINALQQSQRLWVQYRDLNAAAYQTGQSSRKVTKDQYYYYAATVITKSRVAELKLLFLND
jgi:uncharacterized protein YecT (DUF1311 family)